MTERVWQPIHTAPRDGTWFLARTESGYERHVHFADARDRLPIDHKSGLWTTLPVEWCPDPAFQPPEAQPVAFASEPLAALVEALRWYGAAVAECRKLGVYGDQARQLLEQDGGKRAEAALATLKGSN